MNDLQELRRFPADPPDPDDRWLADVRRTVLSADGGRDRRTTATVTTRPRRRLALVAVAATVGVLVILASIVLPLWPVGPDPAVAGVLRRFAHVARNAPAEPPPEPGQYVYWETRSTMTYLFSPGPGLEPFAYEVTSRWQRWAGLDGSGRDISQVGEPRFLTEADRLAYEAFLGSDAKERWGAFDWGRRREDRYGSDELGEPLAFVSDLPTDADALREELERQEALGGSNGDWGVFTWATDILAVSYMSPELRAAFYQVMSTIPGTEMIGPVEDDLGRHGVAIGHTRDGVRDEVVFDRQTGDILAMRTVRVEDDPDGREEIWNDACCGEGAWAGTEAGTVMVSNVYVSEAVIVDSIFERP